jgi:hypothetical protein
MTSIDLTNKRADADCNTRLRTVIMKNHTIALSLSTYARFVNSNVQIKKRVLTDTNDRKYIVRYTKICTYAYG